jgi:hypothetical protein
LADAHDRGRDWDYEVARRTGGRRQPGSGNREYAQLDSRTGLLLVEGKLTEAESIRLSPDMLDQARSAVVGPEAMQGGYEYVIALHVGRGPLDGPALAVLDLDLLIEWIKAPPAIVQATRQDELRATARRPSLLRGLD